jgi:hypothetical protein
MRCSFVTDISGIFSHNNWWINCFIGYRLQEFNLEAKLNATQVSLTEKQRHVELCIIQRSQQNPCTAANYRIPRVTVPRITASQNTSLSSHNFVSYVLLFLILQLHVDVICKYKSFIVSKHIVGLSPKTVLLTNYTLYVDFNNILVIVNKL